MKNRLNLNFQIDSQEERTTFIQNYLNSISFEPNEDELETIANYILWGKNSKGLNAQQEKLIELKKWDNPNVESLEGILEVPNTEYQLRTIQSTHTRIKRTIFNREQELNDAPPYIQDTLRALFRQIDEVELTINFYDIYHEKRTQPPRQSLLDRFTSEEQKLFNEKAQSLNQYSYLKLKRILVALRQDQYDIKDLYKQRLISHMYSYEEDDMPIRLDEDVNVYPLGLKNNTQISQLVFGTLDPTTYTAADLKIISDFLWRPVTPKLRLDFTDPNHLLRIYQARADLYDDTLEDPDHLYNAAQAIIDTLLYYEEKANLTPLQKDILEAKLKKTSNICIAERINAAYGKNYNDNYISTIFHQKILPLIADAAKRHLEIVQNLFYPENFKKCKDCGQVFLLSSDYFVKQKKSHDGFAPRCKNCEKIKRSKYK